jgi:hypothetical protein
MVTDARGTAEPVGSLTEPRTVAVKDCPKVRLLKSNTIVRL